jgi:hypothetical protein
LKTRAGFRIHFKIYSNLEESTMKKLGFFAVLLSCVMFIGCPKKAPEAPAAEEPAAEAPAEATEAAPAAEEAAPAAEEAAPAAEEAAPAAEEAPAA